VWCEGAIFIIGFEKGIREWKKLVADDRYLVVSELSWLQYSPPEEIKKFFTEVHPGIKTVKANLEAIKETGYRVVNHFVLPKEGRSIHYYTPIKRNFIQ
jgi:hypothetical protein